MENITRMKFDPAKYKVYTWKHPMMFLWIALPLKGSISVHTPHNMSIHPSWGVATDYLWCGGESFKFINRSTAAPCSYSYVPHLDPPPKAPPFYGFCLLPCRVSRGPIS